MDKCGHLFHSCCHLWESNWTYINVSLLLVSLASTRREVHTFLMAFE